MNETPDSLQYALLQRGLGNVLTGTGLELSDYLPSLAF